MDKKITSFIAIAFTASASGALLKAAGSPPNVEALMPFVIASSLILGPVYGFANAVLARAFYDAYLSWTGWWTVMTSLSYGLVGVTGALAARHKKNWSRIELTVLACGLTILYDVVTMGIFGVLMHMPLPVLIAGQIPFTINHLLGNCLLCFIFAPILVKAIGKYANTPTKQAEYTPNSSLALSFSKP